MNIDNDSQVMIVIISCRQSPSHFLFCSVLARLYVFVCVGDSGSQATTSVKCEGHLSLLAWIGLIPMLTIISSVTINKSLVSFT